ncbi:MAG: GtrA family protein [Acutalibacteraceae bacterium]
MINKIKELYIKYKEIILYVLFGVLTTAANMLTFYFSTALLGEKLYMLNNFLAWVAGVIVAYITNKLFVFESKSWKLKIFLREFSEFVLARVFSFAVEEVGLIICVDGFGLGGNSINFFGIEITGQFIIKLVLSVIVVIMNYFFSKFVIFKKKKTEEK